MPLKLYTKHTNAYILFSKLNINNNKFIELDNFFIINVSDNMEIYHFTENRLKCIHMLYITDIICNI